MKIFRFVALLAVLAIASVEAQVEPSPEACEDIERQVFENLPLCSTGCYSAAECSIDTGVSEGQCQVCLDHLLGAGAVTTDCTPQPGVCIEG